MEKNCWVDLQELIAEQLKLQVHISFPHHYQFMLNHGLENCRSVLDLGTGNGYFLSQVAKKHPKIKFCGIDSKAHMIKAAKKQTSHNVQYYVGDINDAKTLPDLSLVDGMIMRYLILHLPNIKEIILSTLVNNINRGTKLWIFDLDLNNFYCRPQHSAFTFLKNLIVKFCDKYSIESAAGSRLSLILEEIGFNDIKIETELFTNQHVEKSLFRQFILNEIELYHHFLGPDSDQEEIEAIKNFMKNEETLSCYEMQYGMTMVSATWYMREKAFLPSLFNFAQWV